MAPVWKRPSAPCPSDASPWGEGAAILRPPPAVRAAKQSRAENARVAQNPAVRRSTEDTQLLQSSPAPPCRGCHSRDTSTRRWDRPSRSQSPLRPPRPSLGYKRVLFRYSSVALFLTSRSANVQPTFAIHFRGHWFAAGS